MTGDPKLAIVAPAFNEEESVPEFYRRVTAAARAVVGGDYRIIVVDDGSRDRTFEILRALAASDSRLTAIRLSRNFGHQIALSAGLAVCRGDYVFIIDADLQDPPELLAEMMALAEREQADVVYGKRRQRAGETAFKKTSASLFYRLLARLSDVDIPADTGDFRLVRRRVVDVLNAMPERYRFTRGLVSWIGLKQIAFEYDREARHYGTTHYPLRKMLHFAVDAITSFSVRPLRIASYAGIITSFASLAAMAYSLGSWLFGDTVPGWTSLLSVILLLGSIQLFVIGIIGEYLGRLYLETKRRPLYVISDIENPT